MLEIIIAVSLLFPTCSRQVGFWTSSEFRRATTPIEIGFSFDPCVSVSIRGRFCLSEIFSRPNHYLNGPRMDTDTHGSESELTEAVVGAAFEVANVLGAGFLERV